MDHHQLSLALCSQAQALLSIQRRIDRLAREAARGEMPRVTTLNRISRLLYRTALLSDQVSVLLDGEVEVQVQA